jgi:hypothetical protein
MPESEPAERPGPLDRILGRHHPQLEAPVVRSRLREGLDSAEYLADIRGQHAGDLAVEEAFAIHLYGGPHPARTEVPDPGGDVGGAAQPVLRAPVGVGDHPRVETCARHDRETFPVHRAGVEPAPVAVQSGPHRLGKIVRHVQVRRQEVRGPRGQDRHGRVRVRHRVDASLDGAVATPDEHHVGSLGRCFLRVLGSAAALLYLVPVGIGHAFEGQDPPQLGQAAAEAFPRVRHYGDVSHGAQTFRQRASQSP